MDRFDEEYENEERFWEDDFRMGI